MPEVSKPKDRAATVTASKSMVAAGSGRIARGLADLLGDPRDDEMSPELAALVRALEGPGATPSGGMAYVRATAPVFLGMATTA